MGDERSDFNLSNVEIPKLLEEAEKTADEYEPEWTLQSSLQVLGGFILLFNSYAHN